MYFCEHEFEISKNSVRRFSTAFFSYEATAEIGY